MEPRIPKEGGVGIVNKQTGDDDHVAGHCESCCIFVLQSFISASPVDHIRLQAGRRGRRREGERREATHPHVAMQEGGLKGEQ